MPPDEQYQTIKDILYIIRDDVREVQQALNGYDGLVAKIRVLEAAAVVSTRHMSIIWSTLGSLLIAVIGVIVRLIWK